MMECLLAYVQDRTLQYVLVGIMLSAGSSGLVGTFLLLERKELVGDAVSHALLPGLCLGFMITGRQVPSHLVGGALVSGGLALFLIDLIPRRSKIKEDSATALVLSLFFGVGLALLTYLQRTGNHHQAGLDSFLLGQAASLMWEDVRLFACLALLLAIVVFFCFKELQLLVFDSAYAKSIGWPVRRLSLLLQLLTLLAIVVGIRAVGVIMMVAMLIGPAAAARYWAGSFSQILLLSTFFGAFSGGVGTLFSLLWNDLPTGPCIVLTTTCIALLSFFFAPRKGVLAKMWARRCYRQGVLLENVLKLLYECGGQPDGTHVPQCLETLQVARPFPLFQLERALRALTRQGFVVQVAPGRWQLTAMGMKKGAYMLRMHVLWEAYLIRYLRLPPDHVHEDAEAVEHLLTGKTGELLDQALH